MIKLLSALLSASMLFILSYFFGPEHSITVDAQAPAKVRPGDDFIYEMKVSKGALTGFSRIQVFIPQGLTVTPMETKNAQFLFEEDYVKFIWINLPEEKEFTVSMKIHVDANADGEKYFNGELSYIEDDKTEKYPLKQVTVVLDPSLAPTLTESKPEIERKLIAVTPDQGEYQVELTIHPHQETGSAKFIDDIPDGFTASVVETHGAEFSFTEQNAIFSWASLPTDSVFTISYKVSAGSSKPAPNINGMLVYGDQMLASNSGQSQTVVDSPAQSENTTSAAADAIIETLVASETAKSQTPTESGVAPAAEINIPAPQSGIYFKVQISATRKSPARDNKWFAAKYNWQENVDLSMHEGWKKYLVGTFNDYNQAKAFRNATSTKVSDAFVVAYDNGQRIPVQEALNSKKVNQ